MINPATRKAAAILAEYPGLHTDDLLDAIPAAGDDETIKALHRDGRRHYGYGQDIQGRWWLRTDSAFVDQALAHAEHKMMNRQTQEAS